MQADLQLRNADLSAAQSQLLQLKNGARPQEIQQSQAAVAAAQSQYDGAKKDWDRAQTLYKNDDISTSQYDQFRTRFESTEANLKQVKEQANLVQAGPRAETIESAKAQVERARASLRVGAGQFHRDQAPRAGYCRPPGRYRARQIPDRPDRLPVGRYHCRLADQRRGAGEGRRCG
jgi:multidrug resistance efflux pump